MFSLTPYRRNSIQQSALNLDSLFDDFFSGSFMPSLLPQMETMKVDIKDTEKAYVLEADLPGINKDELKLDFENGRLSIKLERDESLEADKDNYLHRERRIYSSARTFAFANVNSEQISAKYENGVLSVTLPKNETALSKHIQIS